MQEKVIDTRTFPEIWKSLSTDEKSELTAKFIVTKCCRTPQTIWNWSTGKVRPLPIVRDAAAKVISKFIGARVLECTLFPAA